MLLNQADNFKDMQETWNDIPGYEGLYKTSTLGRVKSLVRTKEKILKGCDNGQGYLMVALYKNGKRKYTTVHGLVSMAFLGHKPDGSHRTVVDHVNYNKQDNRVNNLQLITGRENISKDKWRKNPASRYVGVSWAKPNKRWKATILINSKQKFLGYFMNEIDAHNSYQDKLKSLCD